MNELKDALNRFKKLTEDAIGCLEYEDYDKINTLLRLRQDIIDYINSLDFDAEEFKGICTNLDLLKLEQMLNVKMHHKRSELRKQLDSVSVNRNANVAYNKKYSVDSFFFNKKI